MRGMLSNFKRLEFSQLFSGSIKELLHPPAGQIPFLDGLRTVAILLVMDGHLSAKFVEAFGPNRYARIPIVANGWIGVDLFFILSGFLIGGQLWKEIDRTGKVAVGRFILRRGFRIWPLYFFTFVCVLLGSLAFGQNLAAKGYGWSDLVFLTNYSSHGIVEGSWSLCTEEQFYIAVPIILFFFASRTSKLRNYRPWIWALLLSIPALRAVIWVGSTGHFFAHDPILFGRIYYASITHCDGLIMGMLLSNWWVSKEQPRSKILSPWIILLAACVLTVSLYMVQKEVFDFTALALSFGALTWLGLQRRFTIFNPRPFYWISRLSFGMYLNHEYLCPWIVRSVLPRFFSTAQSPALATATGFGVLILLSAAISVVTFCLVEHPFLQMRKVVLGH
jgi:peptidoglycan/LPS O-acetylase OafA/YrhL